MKKLGRIFRPQDYGLDYAQAPSVIQMDGFVRVYFTHRHQKDNDPVSVAGYADFDEDWKILRVNKGPLLPLGKPGTFDEYGTYPVSVIKDGKDYLMYYAGWTRPHGSIPFTIAIGKAIGDGEHFTKVGEGPILTDSIDSPYLKGGPKIRHFNNKWYLFYISGTKWLKYKNTHKPVYKIALNGKLLIEGPENECQAGPDVHYRDGKYHMYFTYRDWDKANYRIGYAYSTDLENWTRTDFKIPLSKKGWDSEMQHYPTVFGDYMIYLGNTYGKYGFGLILL
ncbi:MAG: glycosylase [Candidatus Levybacteria bacterium]|nr:glycosylase [Candidatus Levybacteria bacterium]